MAEFLTISITDLGLLNHLVPRPLQLLLLCLERRKVSPLRAWLDIPVCRLVGSNLPLNVLGPESLLHVLLEGC